ncbi:MAG TPA: DUF427 domain-containing protein [Jiangellales bacterium]|nr:DUF427 domain-containing protein [Jiangellales bacterium]
MTSPRPLESVWAYPRPPRVEPTDELVVVGHAGVEVARTRSALRVLETSHPPTYYVPREAFTVGVLQPAASVRTTTCEFKGVAAYHDLVLPGGGPVVRDAGWSYPSPSRGFEALRGTVALYPGRVDRITVDGEEVTAQEGDFYGGWITARVTGPFKGGPGTWGW